MTRVSVSRDQELAALQRPFRLGLLACVAGIVAIGGLVAAFGTPAHRAAGIAERWLVAVGDTTRDGIEEDAIERAVEHGDPALAGALVPAAAAADGERAFEQVQVGRDTDPASDVAVVPFRLTPYEADDVTGTVTLQRTTDGWQVTALAQVDGVEVDRPERAPAGFWIGALAVGVLVALGCSAAVRAATPKR